MRMVTSQVAAVLLAAAAIAACGSDSDDDEPRASEGDGAGEEVSIGFLATGLQSTDIQARLEGIQQAAEAQGATVEALDGNFDSNTQLRQLQDATTTKQFDAIIIYPTDGAAAAPYAEDAIDAGITVVALTYPLGPDIGSLDPQVEGLASSVLLDPVKYAQYGAEEAVKACADKDPCKVVYMPGFSTFPVEKLRTDTVKKVLAEHPNIELVSSQDGEYSRDTARSVMQNILQANKDVDVFFSPGDQMSLGAELAIDDAGLSGDVTIGGTGASEPAVEAIKEGRWTWSVTLTPISDGKMAGELAIKATRGEEVPESVEGFEDIVPFPVVTEENVERFDPQWPG
jgi:ribose transport system substrate-binding protein